MKLKFTKAREVLGALLGLLILAGSGCTLISTGARSASVVLVPEDGSAAGARALEMPPREQLNSLLSPRFLWFTTDRSSAQWIAYVRVRPPATPLQAPELTLLEIKKNPYWTPLSASDIAAASRRDHEVAPSIKLAEDNQRNEGYRGSNP